MVQAQALLPTTGRVEVTPPAEGEPWDHNEIIVCPTSGGSCLPAVNCSPVAVPPAHTTCSLAGLQAGTEYNATATAVKADGTRSKTSLPGTFGTPTNE